MIKEDNSYDELIFDYLEGNLSTQERQAFEMVMDDNEQLFHQVQVWKRTYVAEEMPEVSLLEKTLLIKSKGGFGISTLVSSIILVACLFVFQNTNPVLYQAEYKVAPIEEVTTQLQTKFSVKEEEVSSAQKQILEAKIIQESILPLSLQSELLPQKIFLQVLTNPEIPEIRELKLMVVKTKKLSPTRFSRKEMRELNQKKRQGQEKRMADQFLKGREAYVVPLNNKNF